VVGSLNELVGELVVAPPQFQELRRDVNGSGRSGCRAGIPRRVSRYRARSARLTISRWNAPDIDEGRSLFGWWRWSVVTPLLTAQYHSGTFALPRFHTVTVQQP